MGYAEEEKQSHKDSNCWVLKSFMHPLCKSIEKNIDLCFILIYSENRQG